MTNLVSEQIPNDGGYHVKRLVDEANARLDQIGKRGKRAKIAAKKTSLSLQFSFEDGNGNKQKNVGIGAISMSAKGILEAEKIANMVTVQLMANQFTWDWYNALIGKDASEKVAVLTCKQMIEEYKKHYLKQRQDNKYPNGTWYITYRHTEKILGNSDKPISLALVREIVESTENNSETRKNTLNGLANLLKYFDNSDYKDLVKKYKNDNKPKSKKRNVPSDKRIVEIFNTGFVPSSRCRKDKIYRYPQWQFLYGLLATYGLRIHEAWNIANWDKPVILKKGDWITVDVNNNDETSQQYDGKELVIPAILDPDNKQHFLCIKNDTKTGYRVASPLSPSGHNWIEEFNLLQFLNLPDIENPLKRSSKGKNSITCSNSTCGWFNDHNYGFTPHDLRHAYNHRGHQLGYNPKALADSLGHSITMNSTGYLRHMSDRVKYEGMVNAMNQEQEKRSENQLLKEEVKALKAEVELLKTKLKMYEAIESSKSS